MIYTLIFLTTIPIGHGPARVDMFIMSKALVPFVKSIQVHIFKLLIDKNIVLVFINIDYSKINYTFMFESYLYLLNYRCAERN